MSTRRFLTAANKIAAQAEAASKSFARALSQVLRDTERRLVPLLRDVTDGSRSALVKAALANKTRLGIREALTNAGYDQLTETALGAPLDRMTARVLSARRIAQQTAKLSGAFDQRLEALRLWYQTDLLDEGEEVARALWKATTRGVFSSQPLERILSDLSDVLDHSEPQIRTLYDTSVSIYGRQVEALQAGDDPEATFAYVGPADDLTREFCLEHVGRVYTREEIDDLDNGQLDNVFLTCGGYQCRHMWMEISKFSELQDLKPGQRIPEIQDALDEAA